jgi:hypothetical protein
MADRQKAEELRYQFFKETGYTWENSQGEPDIDYVYWLENKVIHAQQVEAAPDMLDALQNLENDDNSIPEHAWKLVKDAIAKAMAAS